MDTLYLLVYNNRRITKTEELTEQNLQDQKDRKLEILKVGRYPNPEWMENNGEFSEMFYE